MEKSKVVLIRCDDYDETRVEEAVKRGLEMLGGATAFVKAGEKIVLKPNVLWGSDPAKSVTTHPAVFKAAARQFQKAGAVLSYGDSPGFGALEGHMRKAELKPAADSLGITLGDFGNGVAVSHKTSLLVKNFIIAKGVMEADGLISLSKLKTHAFMRFTGAVKNQFGCIPGMLKSQFHVKMPDPNDFGAMLVDLNTLIKPRLYIMDGIVAMEGNGPRNGQPRAMKALLFSTDPIALDAIACKLINLNPEFVPTCKMGEKAGLGTYHYENIEVLGDKVEPLIAADFKVIRQAPGPVTSGRLKAFIKNQITSRPTVDRAKCTACGTCLTVCPVGEKSLHWVKMGEKKFPRHEYSHCIRCYCCQEMCPEGAIGVNTPWPGKLIFRH